VIIVSPIAPKRVRSASATGTLATSLRADASVNTGVSSMLRRT
jgi:hypothetical protein